MTHAPNRPASRGRRLLGILLVGGTGLGAALAALPAAADPPANKPAVTGPVAGHCEIDRLAEPADADLSSTWGMSANGRYVVGTAADRDSAQGRRALLWQDGELTEVEFPDDVSDQYLRAVNSSGTAVGIAADSDLNIVPFIHQEDELSRLPGFDDAWPRAINERGDAVGRMYRSWEQHLPAWWPHGEEGRQLPPPDADAVFGDANDIDEDRRIVGRVLDADRVPRAFLWRPDGEVTALPPLSAEHDRSWASSIAGDRVVGGSGLTSAIDGVDHQTVPVLWTLAADPAASEVRELTGLTTALRVNADGWVAGYTDDAAVLYTGDEIWKLPRLVEGADRSFIADVSDVLDDGTVRVAGRAYDADDNTRAVVWTCGR